MTKKKRPIFIKLLFPILLLVLVEIFILVVTFFGQGLSRQLRQNEETILEQTVVTRKTYLEGLFVRDWMDIDATLSEIESAAEQLDTEGVVDLANLDSDPNNTVFLTEVAPKLVDLMRYNRLSGAYLILNNDDLSTAQATAKPGLYFRDQDPAGGYDSKNSDIFRKVSPHGLNIGTTSVWKPYFEFEGADDSFFEFLRMPYMQATQGEGDLSDNLFGYWGIIENPDEEKGEEALLSYTYPLVAKNQVIGVIGIDITFEYLKELLPSKELNENGKAAYFLAQLDDDGNVLHHFGAGNLKEISVVNGEAISDGNQFVHAEPLRIYDNNTPFSGETWALVGVLPHEYMYRPVLNLNVALLTAVIIALVVSVLAALLISYLLQKPVARLSNEVESVNVNRVRTVRFNPTGIAELDKLSSAISKLSADILENGRKFSQIMRISNKNLAGYAVDTAENSLFLTSNFFEVFGRAELQREDMTVEEFESILASFDEFLDLNQSSRGTANLYHIPADGQFKYISLQFYEDEKGRYGLAEDLTEEFLEKQILQHERDHDALTNMYNRRAFRRELHLLFENASRKVGVGALVMIDLDNLKYVNDTYGHDSGDKYIIKAAEMIAETAGKHAITARISGDEFMVFFYSLGKQRILDKIQKLQQAVNSAYITLPDGKTHSLHATGGVAWYPDDSRAFDDLTKYADHAMYMAKQTHKRTLMNFDKSIFQSQEFLLRNSALLTQMIEDKLLHYAFQPIFDVKTGNVFAVEALMRPDVSQYFNVGEAMETARRDGKLNQIEELTFTMALQAFDEHVRKGTIPKNTHVFINSIPNQILTKKTETRLLAQFKRYGPQIVIELTEDERINSEAWEYKMGKHRALGGKIALDDYGAGYNSEKTLLDISPDFIKVDISIIRGIHLSHDKQTIMEYITHYAHERGKYIIAEGVETQEEVRALVELGVDYVQGYLFAKPQQIPQILAPEQVLALING